MEELILILLELAQLLTENSGESEVLAEKLPDMLKHLQTIAEQSQLIVSYLSVTTDLLQCIGGFICGSLLASAVIKGFKF